MNTTVSDVLKSPEAKLKMPFSFCRSKVVVNRIYTFYRKKRAHCHSVSRASSPMTQLGQSGPMTPTNTAALLCDEQLGDVFFLLLDFCDRALVTDLPQRSSC